MYWAVWALYTVIIIFLALHHEPWADEYKVWHMAYTLSLPDLIGAMRVEGHFCLWHLLVWPFVRIFGMDWHALYAVSIPLMSLAAWLILFKLKFNFSAKLFLIFSAPFLYSFPVVARCYALIPPILAIIVILWQRKSSPFWFCLFVGLLAHTHAYMEGLVGIIWCIFVYKYVISFWNTDRQRARRNLYASGVTFLMVLLAFLQIEGSIVDAGNGTGPAFKSAQSWDSWILEWMTAHRFRIFTTLRNAFGTWIPNLDLVIAIASLAVFSVAVSFFAAQQEHLNRKEIAWIVTAGSLWQLYFATNIYFMQFQRTYLFLAPVILILGMYYHPRVGKMCLVALGALWMLNTPSQYIIPKDILKEYNYDTGNARTINELIPENATIICDGVSSARLLKRDITWDDIETINDLPDDVWYISYDETVKVPDNYQITPVWSGIEGNAEITDIQYEVPIYLYHFYTVCDD